LVEERLELGEVGAQELGSIPHVPSSRNPGVSTTYPPVATGTTRAARVVCFPVSHFALISPMRRFNPGSSAFRRLDFPTPD